MLELEVKFLIKDLRSVVQRLKALGARQLTPETHEINLRFDKPDGSLRRAHRVIRLRRDTRVWLTHKAPGPLTEGVLARQEIEFEVSDFETARSFLEALGFEVSLIYEKYRSTYQIGDIEVVLDRTPLGDFTELEGPDGKAIRAAAERLELPWAAAVQAGYVDLFERVKAALGLTFRDLTFEDFEGVSEVSKALGIREV